MLFQTSSYASCTDPPHCHTYCYLSYPNLSTIRVWLREAFTDDDLEMQDIIIAKDLAYAEELRRQMETDYKTKDHRNKWKKQVDMIFYI